MNAANIEDNAPGWRVQWHEEVTSTNDLAREAGQRGEPGFLAIFTDAQTAGRGQRSNRWLTPKGQDLMVSVLLRPEVKLEHWPRATTLAALAVCHAIEATLPLQPRIKWPNDIYLGERKVAGLLAETASGPQGAFLVLGIGVNVNASRFAPELQERATSLRCELPALLQQREIDRETLAAALLQALSASFTQWADDYHEAIAAVRQRSLLIGKNIRARVNENTIHGRVLDLNHEGHLLIQLADGSLQTLSSAAEVRW